jgi:hypothetical protein
VPVPAHAERDADDAGPEQPADDRDASQRPRDVAKRRDDAAQREMPGLEVNLTGQAEAEQPGVQREAVEPYTTRVERPPGGISR